MAKNKVEKVTLDSLELTNNDLFIKKNVDELAPTAKIVVPETHWGLLIKDGVVQNNLEPGAHPIFETKKGLFGIKKNEDYIVEIIYFSKTAELYLLWGIPQFSFVDPLTKISVKAGFSGESGIRVDNPKKFYLSLIGTDKRSTLDTIKERLKGIMKSEIGPIVEEEMNKRNLSFIQLTESVKKEVSLSVCASLSKKFINEYGLKVSNFLILNAGIDLDSRTLIEQEFEKISKEKEDEKKLEKQKENYRWWIEEYERLENKKFERELLMRELEAKDYEKYLEVCKIVGFENNKQKEAPSKGFCPKCGNPIKPNTKFCPYCGNKLGKKICPNCGKENEDNCNFCTDCGSKL